VVKNAGVKFHLKQKSVSSYFKGLIVKEHARYKKTHKKNII